MKSKHKILVLVLDVRILKTCSASQDRNTFSCHESLRYGHHGWLVAGEVAAAGYPETRDYFKITRAYT